ncbi:unnamed protein product [Rotaria sordida]|uniref:Uncharacterized protein n=1 Tax=Rotaria sordida TaxID=392033 RepID=A0A814IYU2_9BILA|nr:unnamed protein product [Rotaria sordida]CAF3951146.1 unnamed protein product [Rotaria sordida]
MDLDPMINASEDENTYSDYDNRPIRPMDQDALNEALARLPILIDEDDLTRNSDPNTSIKSRRQPVLAYSTRRKNFSGVNINQTVLNVTGTPTNNNKRKLGGCTPMNKFIKQIDAHQDLINLKEENKILEEAKANLQLEYVLLKKSHETELERLKQEHQQEIETLIQEHNLQREQFNTSLADKDQILFQTNLELDNLRNNHMMLLLEKETLDKIVAEYQLIKEEMNNKLIENETNIKKLQEELENMKNIQQQKQLTLKSSLANGRMPIKEISTDRSRTTNNTISRDTNNETNRSKSNKKVSNTRGPLCSTSSVTTNLNKSTSSTCSSTSTNKPPLSKLKLKPNIVIDNKKKLTSTDKHINLASTHLKTKIVTMK